MSSALPTPILALRVQPRGAPGSGGHL